MTAMETTVSETDIFASSTCYHNIMCECCSFGDDFRKTYPDLSPCCGDEFLRQYTVASAWLNEFAVDVAFVDMMKASLCGDTHFAHSTRARLRFCPELSLDSCCSGF